MIQDVLYDLNLFVDGRGFAGRVKELRLPVIKAKVQEYDAGGMAASIDVPLGRIEKLDAEATLASFDADTQKLFRVLPGEQFAFTARGAMVSDDGATKPVIVTMRGILTSIDHGTWKAGDEMPLKIEMSLRYYRLEIDGDAIVEVDPVNYVMIVGGKDQLESTRAALAI